MYVKTWKRPGFAYLPEKIFGNKLKAHFVYLLLKECAQSKRNFCLRAAARMESR